MKAKDKRMKVNGEKIYSFANQCFTQKKYDLAIKAGSSAAARYKAGFPTGKEIFANGLKDAPRAREYSHPGRAVR